MKANLFIAMVLLSFFSKAQSEYCSMDSIECFFIPLNIKTIYNVNHNEIISGNKFKEIAVTKSKILNEDNLNSFSLMELDDSSQVFVDRSISSADDVDARIVLLLRSNNMVDTLVVDPTGFYFFKNRFFKPNIKLMLWINEYGSNTTHYQIFNDSLSNELKIKYDFLVNTIK